jgi:uncharacterized membrane protein YtjA (UPF0391 family)
MPPWGAYSEWACRTDRKDVVVLEWILTLLVIATAATLFVFPKLAGASSSVAQVLVFIVLAVLLVYLVVGVFAVA